jgi:hypothetical protein
MTTSDWIGASGDWSNASDWTNGVPNDSSAVADLGGTNFYTVTIAGPLEGGSTEGFTVGTLNITDPNAALKVDGTLTVASAINISAGTLAIAGTIVGGTITQMGGKIVFSNIGPDWTGTLDGVTFKGTMDLSGDKAAVNIKDGLIVLPSFGNGSGLINDIGAGSALNFVGSQTFDNARINIGGAGYSSYLNAWDDNGAPATLTLGQRSVISTLTGNATIAGSADATIVNRGTIAAGTDRTTLWIDGATFTNQGTIDIENGQTVIIDSPHFSNSGTIAVGERGTLELSGNLVGTQLGYITVNGGFVWIKGTLDNRGNVLAVGQGSRLGTVSLYGTIRSGTIEDSGSGLNFQHNAQLVGVTYLGTMGIHEGGLTIAGGLTLKTLDGTGKGEFDIGGGLVTFQGTQTINNATLKLGEGPLTASLNVETGPGASAATLTFGAGLTLMASPYASIGGNGKLVNLGRIISDGNGVFTISSATFVNRGAVVVAGGEDLMVQTGFTNDGNLEIIHGLLDLQKTAAGTGNYQIDSVGTLEFDSSVGAGQIVKFYRAGGTLQIGAANAFKAGGIYGFAAGDSIDLANVTFGGSTRLSYTGNKDGGTLVVSDGAHTARLKLFGAYSQSSFAAASDGASGTAITYTGPAAAVEVDSKLHQFTAAIAAHSADAAFSPGDAIHRLGEPVHGSVLAAPWHH